MRSELLNSLITRSQSASPNKPVTLYVIREDGEWSGMQIDWYFDLLSRSANLEVVMLFRHTTPIVWSSFQNIAAYLLTKWRSAGLDEKILRAKLLGWHRHPSIAEDSFASLPFSGSMLLVDDRSKLQLTSTVLVERAYRNRRTNGENHFTAEYHSTLLMPASQVAATEVRRWIGAEPIHGFYSNNWVELDWPDG